MKAARTHKVRNYKYENKTSYGIPKGLEHWWRKHRKVFLHYNPLCVKCSEDGYTTPATEVHHTKRHRGDRRIFMDKRYWQALCKPCHSRKTAKEVHRRK